MDKPIVALTTACALAFAAGASQAATFTTVQDGNWYCESQTGSNCAFGTAGNLSPSDKAVIQHGTAVAGVPAEPKPAQAAGIDLVAGYLGIYGGMRLEFGGGTFSGGGLDSCCNGGGTWANEGALSITANPFPVYRGNFENNGTMTIASGAMWIWNQGNGGGVLSNLTVGQIPAALVLDGTASLGGAGTVTNEGVLRKTGAGTATIFGSVKSLGKSLIQPGSIEVQEGSLVLADALGFNGELASEGSSFSVAAGASFSIRDGGRMRLTPESGATQVYRTTGSGDGHVRLEAGGTLLGDFRLQGLGVSAVMDFEPGVFEWTGGGMSSFQIRNEGEITIAGPDAKGVYSAELENAGLVRLLSGTFDDAGILNIVPGGVFEVADGTSIVQAGNNPRLFVDGTLRKLAGAGTFTVTNVTPQGSGTIEVNGGHLVLDQNATCACENTLDSFLGTLDLRAGAQLDVTPTVAGSATVQAEAAVVGVGTIASSYLAHRGRLEPGSPYGALAITGTVRQEYFGEPGVRTRFHVGGPQPLTQYSQLQVGGDLRPFGVLRVQFRDGYSPLAGDAFDLITVAGAFTETTVANYQVVIEGLAPWFQYTLTKSAQNTVRLTALNHVPSLDEYIFGGPYGGFED